MLVTTEATLQPERDPSHSTYELLITDPHEIGRLAVELTKSGALVDIDIDPGADGPYSHLREELYDRIVGQNTAIDALVDSLNDSDFTDPDRPIGTFIFMGPTGVGKSQLTKEISRLLHANSHDAYQSINCTQLKSSGDITMLQGSPLGYIGYGDNTILDPEKLKKPRNVLVFDEIEKAHPVIHDYLMQVLDEGEITLFTTREKLSLKNSIIILTSNAGSREVNDQLFKKTAGFKNDTDPQSLPSREKLLEISLEALDKVFAPELLGRINDKILFTHLTDEHHALALQQYEQEMNRREPFKKIGVSLETSPDLRNELVRLTDRRSKGGFREVRATYEREVERMFIKLIRTGRIPHHSIAHAVVASEETKEKYPDAIVDFRTDHLSA